MNYSLPVSAWEHISTAAGVAAFANGLTHGLYRYPAMMSPQLARSIILSLTKHGDVILDPFVGGGTTAVEALAHGRNVVCSDLNSLACFATRAKATPISNRALERFDEWFARVWEAVNKKHFAAPRSLAIGNRRYASRTHGLLQAIKDSAQGLEDLAARRVALLTVLRSGQLCFDSQRRRVSPQLLLRTFGYWAPHSSERIRSYSEQCRTAFREMESPRRFRVLNKAAERLNNSDLQPVAGNIKLLLTSPPYPGVHVLYHRWQVMGRRETDLPYKLVGLQNGRFESSYTMGPRHEATCDKYFVSLGRVFSKLRTLLPQEAIVAQVVGFSMPSKHLGRFLQVMAESGFAQVKAPHCDTDFIARPVPHRRWYAALSAEQSAAANEFVIFHRPA